MFKKLVSTILIMALLLQCSALTVFADSEIAELLDVDAATVATGTDLSVPTKPEVAPENATPDEPKQEDATQDQPEEETEDVQASEDQVTLPEEKMEQPSETPSEKEEQAVVIPEASKEEEKAPSSSDVVIETPVIPEDNTQEKFEESLETVDNTANEDLTEGRREYFSLYESEVPALKEIVKDNYAGADAVNYNAFYGPYNGTIAFEDSTAKTVRTIFNTYENNLDLSKYEAIIGLYLFGEDEEDAPVVKLEVVYASESNAPLYFENAAGAIVELGTPKLNAQDGLFHSVVLLNKEALDKLNFYSNPGYMADVLKIVGTDAVIHAISISADRYCFANAVEMISDVESTYPVAGTTIQFPEGMGYGYSVSYNDGALSFNCLKDSWIEILFDNENVEITAEDTFAFTLPEVPAGKVEATLPKDDEKKNGEKDKDEKDEENKLATDTDLKVPSKATDTDLNVNDNESNDSNPVADEVLIAETVLDTFEPTTGVTEVQEITETETIIDVTEDVSEVEEVTDEAVEEAEAAETVDEVIEESDANEAVDEILEEEYEDTVILDAEETEQEESAAETEEASEETEDYSVIEDLVEEDTTPIEYDSTEIEYDSTEIDFNE